MNVIMRRMSEFSPAELTDLWNEGFKGYSVPITMSMDMLLKRSADQGLSLAHSIVGCVDGVPVGFVMNGLRMNEGVKTAWNGGTGIIPDYRGKGIGKLLIKASLELYKAEGAEAALLEALSDNKPAISLYERMGYEVIDELFFYECTSLNDEALAGGSGEYEFRRGIPQDIQRLYVPVNNQPWQTQWESVVNGESLIAFDPEGRPAGYALYKRGFDNQGAHTSTSLFQCKILGEQSENALTLMKGLLSEVLGPSSRGLTLRTVNIPGTETMLTSVLKEAGFGISVSQVHMKRSV
ncbi:ribosomal protein S18 acetylase RimI-like enzyme [Paenibacillus rhizosphaerae]|uniref:Ribosomal protein S18 acetylase RimI-like enzyme n=1 Tax=Paenibacillus rhizosphaerae TaxID=297318 RepID=A0A839TMW9_9BACL|nr:GNAT family N-acetyltransferase [Paenibacillus rhizosphaerae]MBB3126127.1 ribosomal protein S18 acetylase RimI-like enzyme [Paenibacillus rhizosphaerae]